MDAKTREALEGSIAKWEAIVAGTGVDDGPRNCPLCKQFFRDDLCGQLANCDGCPVKAKTGVHGCNDTPYTAWTDWHEDIGQDVGVDEKDQLDFDDPDHEGREDAARAELEFLKSLRPSDG